MKAKSATVLAVRLSVNSCALFRSILPNSLTCSITTSALRINSSQVEQYTCQPENNPLTFWLWHITRLKTSITGAHVRLVAALQSTVMEAEKAELKSILRGLLISSPKQMTVRDLANDFSKQEGREFPYQKFGFRTFVDYLKTIKDTVVLSGCQPIYVTPVVKQSTAHVNELVLKQKSTSKKSSYKTLEKSQRKRGWVPIVIPPDPAKTLPTLLDIKIPSRTKYMLDAPATRRTTRNSAYHSFQKLKVDSEYKNVDSAETAKNYASVVYEKDTDSQENTFPHLKSGKKADVCYDLDNKTKTVASKPSEKWEDICDENKGHDDSLFEKYCVQNIKFRSINNIDEWFPKEVPEISPKNYVVASQESKDTKNVGRHVKQSENATIGRHAKQSEDATIGRHAKQSEDATIGRHAKQSENATIGRYVKQSENATFGRHAKQSENTTLGRHAKQSENATFGRHAKQSEDATVGRHAKQSEDATVGRHAKQSEDATVGRHAKQSDNATVGRHAKQSENATFGRHAKQSENVTNCITRNSSTEFSETKTDWSLLNEQNIRRTSTSSSPVPSSESGFNTSSSQNRLFSEKTVSNMKKLIKENPQGLWASEFPAIYKEYFGVPLDYHAYGYVSMAAVAAAYSDVFICLRRSSADFLLFDSDTPLPKHYANSANMNSCGVVTEVIKSNVERLIAEFPTGLPVEKFKEMYKLYFSEELNEGELGFSSVYDMLQTLHEEFILRIRKVGKNTVLYPVRNPESDQHVPPLGNSVMEYDTAEPYTEYPPEVLDPHDTIQRQPLPRFREDFPVLVSDVTTPSCFSMIVFDLRNQLENLMDEIQFFYSTEGEKYKMPHNAICEGLLCVARYEKNQEWHRAKICNIKGGMSKIKINYIDYGTVGFVKSEDLRFMHRDFAQFPLQGIPSRLANIEPAMGEWTKEVSQYFLDLVCGKVLMAVIDRTNQGNRISVGLVDTSGEDDIHINDQLVLMGYAKFKHDPPQNLPDVSNDGSALGLENGDFEMNKGKSDGEMFHDEEFSNCADSYLAPSSVTELAYNNEIWPLSSSGTRNDDPPQNSPTVSIELDEPELQNSFERNNWKFDGKSFHGQTLTNGGDASFVSSTITEPTYDKWKGPLLFSGATRDNQKANIDSEKQCQSRTTNATNGSANMWYEKPQCKSPVNTKSLENSILPSKEDIMKVWNTSVISTSINAPSIPDESEPSLNLKKIPNTWKDVKYSTALETDPKRDKGNAQLSNKMQNASTGDTIELPSRNSVSPLSGNTQSGNSHTSFMPAKGRNEIPHSIPAPSNSGKDNSFAHHGLYAHNMWNLGNISVNTPWIPSGNHPVVNNVSSLVQAGQTAWFHPVSNTPQFPLTPIVGVTPLPPPGFTPIQNPFVAFTAPRLPAVDPRLSILDGAFLYQHQSNPWISRFSEMTSTPNHRSFANPAGHFFTSHNNSGKFSSPTPDIREISQSTENLLSEEESEIGSKDAESKLESSKLNLHNHEVKPCAISQCTQTTLYEEVSEDTLQNNGQSSETKTSDTVTETSNRNEIDSDKETNMASENNMKLENENKSPDSYVFSENCSEVVQNAEQDSEPTEKIDVENELCKSLQRLQIDTSVGSTDQSEEKLSWAIQHSVKNDNLHLYPAETDTRDEEEITRLVSSQEVEDTNEEKGRQPVRHIKKILISGRVLNLINYNEQAYFCTDEFVRTFSKFSGRHVLLKILDTNSVILPFVEVNRSDNFEMFQMLDNCDLNTKSRKPNGQIHDVLHLVPLRSATELLKALKISDVAIIASLMEEVENFNPEDDYWYRD